MSEIDPDSLSDLACGLFLHLLNRVLHDQGLALFILVEKRVDFREAFLEVFHSFCEDYPVLGEAMRGDMVDLKAFTSSYGEEKG